MISDMCSTSKLINMVSSNLETDIVKYKYQRFV
jgi:hypothetical protein